ncbi:MAG: enoyl-ACP reductase [Capsulimonadaceae bacterium]|nr:enoyl-ACP reductase [Capsulimonadaceae bacterium]
MLLENKNVLIYGVRNKRSLAWGAAQSVAREGARLCLTYLSEREGDDVRKLVQELPNSESVLIVPCDLTVPEQVTSLHERIKEEFGTLDAMLHAVAFAKKEDLDGHYLDTSRDGFLLALEVSAFSFVTACKHAVPLMTNGGSLLTLTYQGSQRVVPNYNLMGVAKAALEASVRYLANDLGPQNIRVNAVSPGPTMTLSARGISGFVELHKLVTEKAPLRRNTNIEEVGDTVAFMASDYARGITGEILLVDAGVHILGS